MSREDVKAEDLVQQLRAQFAASIREAIAGVPAAQALQVADGLCTVWIEALAGLRVTHKALPVVDGAAITAAWRNERPLAEIMQCFGCSRATAYRHHPTRVAKDARRGGATGG